MGKLSMLIVVATLMALMLASEGRSMQQQGTFQVVQTDDIFGWLCKNSPMASSFDWCKATTTLASTVASSAKPNPTTQVIDSTTVKTSRTTKAVDSTTIKSSTTTEVIDSTTETVDSTTEVVDSTPVQSTAPMSDSTDTSSEPSALERAHWCMFDNGTYVSLGQTFMYTSCLLCQCTQTRDIRCHSLQCKATYCVDGTKAVVKDGECCPQCITDTSTSCVYGGITFPQGSIIRNMVENIQCWCQSGSIECRAMATTQSTTSTVASYASMDYFSGSGNSSVYIIVVIICALVILASLICCGCAVVYYYYYYQTQQSAQQAYDQYYGTAGWQPMGDDGQVVDESALEKQAEAERGQNEENYPTGSSQQYVPPPYATYNGPYGNGDRH